MVTKTSVANFAATLLAVAMCAPELMTKGDENMLFSSKELSPFLTWVPQSIMFVGSIMTMWVSHFKSWPCLLGNLLVVVSAVNVLLVALQLSISSFPAAISTCCCFPEQCFYQSMAQDLAEQTSTIIMNATACESLKETACGGLQPAERYA